MALTVGTRLGPYEVTAQIGVGGMGEVYRATDTNLKRSVAIKVLPDSFANDADRLARFTREAQTLASLNHPNIAAIHGLEESNGVRALVMELVDGEDLSQRIAREAIPLDEALPIARQIAQALEAAHEQGIIHRDLKPANIKLRADGTVKVLDFGLARAGAAGASAVEALNSPTFMSPAALTMGGMILGTASYMAPEQARGKTVDKRADIWAFGVVLYEMITGRRPFGRSTVAGSSHAAANDDREDVASVLAAVIQSEPRWDSVPASLRPLLESCLQKDPRMRLRDIGDAWKLMDAAPTVPVPARGGALGWIAAGLLAIVTAIALWAPWRGESPPALREPMRFKVDAGTDVVLPPLSAPTFSSVVISPDGTRLVYVGSVRGGPPKLLTRRLDQAEFSELVGTEGASNPFFSRDGQWVGFWNAGALFKVPVESGGATKLADVPAMTGGDWTEAGDLIVGAGDAASSVLRISPAGAMTSLLELANGEWFHTHPRVLPGGKHILMEVVTRSAAQGPYAIDVASLADRQRKTVVRGGGSPRYLESGHLVYTNRATMFALPFDLERLEARGTPVRVLDDVAFDTVASGAQYDVSRTGTLVYRRYPGERSASTVQWVDSTGKSAPLLTRVGVYETPRLSPDGTRIAITVKDGVNYDIWVYEPARDAMTRLTLGGIRAGNPVWTPDGQYVIFGLLGSGILSARADGAGSPQPLLPTKGVQLPTAVTRDGKRLAYFHPDANPQIWTVPLEQDSSGLKAGTPVRFLTTKSVDVDATFSPDGRWLAYASNESGRFEIYVRAIAADGAPGTRRWVISNNGGTSPRWSPDGRDPLYLVGNQIMAVGYAARGESFVAEKARVWAADVRTTGGFDPSPDGKRVAVSVPTSTASAGPEQSFIFILNFFDELRRRVPVSP